MYAAVARPTFSDDAWADMEPVAKQRLLSAMLRQDLDLQHTMQLLFGARAFSASKLHLFTEGSAFFTAELEAIRQAQESVELESYIFHDDVVGRAYLEALTERAREGVKVRLLLDAEEIAAASIPRTVPYRFSLSEGMTLRRDRGSAVSHDYRAPFPLTAVSLRSVTFELDDATPLPAAADRLAALAAASPYSLEIRVSLDGATAEENDAVRGHGSFARALSAIARGADAADVYVMFGGKSEPGPVNWMRVVDPDGREIFRYDKLWDRPAAPMPGVFSIDGVG